MGDVSGEKSGLETPPLPQGKGEEFGAPQVNVSKGFTKNPERA